MNPYLHSVVSSLVKRKHQRRGRSVPPGINKIVRDTEVEVAHAAADTSLVILGATVAALGLRGFLLPIHFLDGGVTGISLIASEVTGLPVSALIVAINAPFLLLARFSIGPAFALKSLVGIACLGAFVLLVPYPVVTKDPLLVAAFGGLFLGLGLGLAIRGGAILDGTEVLAIAVSRRTTMSVGTVVLLLNLFIFAAGAAVANVEIALYAVLTYFATAKTVDFVVDGIEEFVGITIVSTDPEGVRQAITERLGRGCTLYHGASGYRSDATARPNLIIVYTVLTRLEVARFRTELDKVDRDAFVVMTAVKDATGGVIKRRALARLHAGSDDAAPRPASR